MNHNLSLIILSFLFAFTACKDPEKVAVHAPESLSDGWEVLQVDSAFEAEKLEQLLLSIPSDNPRMDGIVIARHGKLIVDQYFNGYTSDNLHKMWSLTKPVTGTLVGIAVDKGLLAEKDSLYTYLSDYMTDPASSKGAITIEHLMTMTSGIEWKELGGPGSAGFQIAYSPDWIRFILDLPHTDTPGTVFNYATGNTLLLAPILKKATGMQANEFAEEHLFVPLGITSYRWDRQSEFWTETQEGELPGAKQPEQITYKPPFSELTNTGTGLRLRPRDICKFGQLYLNKGKWNGTQVVSESWILKSIQPHFGNAEYGYHWKLMTTFKDQPCYYATGFGLQRICVFPALDMVVVMTQQHYTTMPEGEKWTIGFLANLLAAVKQ